MAAVNLPQCQANLTQATGHKDSFIFAIFVPEKTTLCMLGLKFLELFSSVHFDRVWKVFVGLESWLNVIIIVIIFFFQTDDSSNCTQTFSVVPGRICIFKSFLIGQPLPYHNHHNLSV